MTIKISSPIEKVFWFNSPPIDERNGWFIKEADCPCCGDPHANIESFRVAHHQFRKRLVCDLCHYGEMEGGEDGTVLCMREV